MYSRIKHFLPRGFFKDDKDDTERRPMVSITFDDGWDTDYWCFEQMRIRGLKGTTYIVGSYVGGTNRLTELQLQEMSSGGWEVGCHTWGHIDLTTLTDEQVFTQLYDNKVYLENLTGKEIVSHVPPFGGFDGNVRNLINGVYSFTKKTNHRYMEYGEAGNSDYIPGWYIDTSSVASIKALIDGAINNRVWICLSLHKVADESSFLSPAEFLEVADYLKTKKLDGVLDVVTVKEGAKRIIV